MPRTAAALVAVELEQVANQHDEDADEQQEGDDRKREEDERFDGRLGVEQRLVEGVQRGEKQEEKKQADAQADDPCATAVSGLPMWRSVRRGREG